MLRLIVKKHPTILHHVQTPECVARLVARGADVDAVDRSTHTPFMYQCMRLNWLVCEALLMKDANPDATDNRGNNVIHLHVNAGYRHHFDRLVEYGANINHANKSGCTPIMLAYTKHDVATYDALIRAGANMPPESHTFDERRIYSEEYLRDEDRPEFPDAWKYGDIMYFADRGRMDLVDRLRANGTANVQSRDKRGNTILFENVDFKPWVEMGAELDWCNRNGETPLEYWINRNRGDNAIALIECGARLPEKTYLKEKLAAIVGLEKWNKVFRLVHVLEKQQQSTESTE